MRLKKHREDVKWLELKVKHNEVDGKGCVLCQSLKRYRHLISWAEAVLDEVSPNVVTMERRERKVVEDGK